jgi:hypothetical protein
MVKESGAHHSILQQVYYADADKDAIFKYLLCTILTNILHNVHRGMVELKGSVIGKHTNYHIPFCAL